LRDVIKEILAKKEFSVTLRGCCFCFNWPNNSISEFHRKIRHSTNGRQIIIVLQFEQSINSRYAKTVCSVHRITQYIIAMAAEKIRIAPDAKKAAFFLLWLFMRRFDRP
jgi:hypothetical protein